MWTDWVDPKMEELSSGMIRSYMGTYEMFLCHNAKSMTRPGARAVSRCHAHSAGNYTKAERVEKDSGLGDETIKKPEAP